jgi:hypothetical protein
VTQAVKDGVARVWSAPALLTSMTALSLLYPLHPNAASRRVLAEYIVVGSFLLGGIIDRYARARPTRAFGFFGACGRHFGAMLRLAAIEVLLYLAVDNLSSATFEAAGGAAVINLLMVYARVRLVVEDRRSAFGALLAASRFLARNPSASLVYTFWMVAAVLAALYAHGAGPIFVLPLFASAAAFFQSRLAHAGYTAAPPLQWPESPAAEAIANRR